MNYTIKLEEGITKITSLKTNVRIKLYLKLITRILIKPLIRIYKYLSMSTGIFLLQITI